MVLVHDTSSRRGLQVYQVSLKNLERFSSYRADTICDRQTDGRTDRRTDGQTDTRGKTICLPTLKGGDIKILLKFSIFTAENNFCTSHSVCMVTQTAIPGLILILSDLCKCLKMQKN